MKAPEFLKDLDGLETNRINQLVVKETLQTTRDENGSGANMVTYRGHIVWKSTAAISRIDLFPQYGNFLTGSRVTLYGIVGA